MNASVVVVYFSHTLMSSLIGYKKNEVAQTLDGEDTFLTSPHTFIDVPPFIIKLISNDML